LGLLLARAGVDVLVLEKHPDFLRDFRGDTIHPSTLDVLAELGLVTRFLDLPHSEITDVTMRLPNGERLVVDIARAGGRLPLVPFVPQWDFLDFITAEAARYPHFRLIRNAEVVDLVQENGVIAGVHARTPDGELTVRALLTIGADGRTSCTRKA